MAKILIAGCGKIGTKLGCNLATAGHQVWGARRNISGIPHQIKPLAVDFLEPQTFCVMPESFEFVFIILTADKFNDDSYKRHYVDSVRNILAHFEQEDEKPVHIFYTSSASVYGQMDGEIIHENSETKPTYFSGKRMLEAEQLLDNCSIPTTCVRFAGIYGSRRTRLIDRIRKGIANYNTLKNFRNLIHEDDVVGIYEHLLSVPIKERIYNGVDCKPVRECDLLDWLSVKLGVSINHDAPIETPYEKRNISNKRCSSRKIIESGYDFLFPTYKEGYKTVIEQYV